MHEESNKNRANKIIVNKYFKNLAKEINEKKKTKRKYLNRENGQPLIDYIIVF